MAATISVDLNARIAQFETEMKKATGTLNRFDSNATRVSSSITKAFGALGVGLSVAAFAGFIKGAIDAQDHLNDLSKTTLLSVETLSGLSLAAKQSGSDLDGTAAAINKLAVNMGKNAEKFTALGITAKDPLKAFGQFADVFNQIEDPQQRAAVGAAALGKSWQDAVPLLSEGSKKMQEMIEKGQALSGVTKESAQRADEFNDRLAELATSSSSWGVVIADPIIKALIKISDALGKEIRFEPGSIGYFIATGGETSARVQQGSRDTGLLQIGSNKKLGAIKDAAVPAKPSRSALDDFIGTKTAAAADKAKAAYDSLIASIREKISVQDAELNSTFKLTDAAKEYAKFLSNVVDGTLKLSPKELTNLAPLWDDFLRKADALQAKQRDIATNAARLQIGDLQQGFSLSNSGIADGQKIMSESARRLADSLRAVDEQGRHTGDVFRKLFNEGNIDADQYTQLIKELTGALGEQKGAVTELEAVQQKLNASWVYGASSALQIYMDEASNVAQQSKDLFTRAFQSMEDALVAFARTGKLSFHDLANSIIDDLIRIQIKKTMTGLFGDSGIGSFLPLIASAFGPSTQSAAPVVKLDRMASFAVGTDFVPRDMIAQIHKGEAIIPAAQNKGRSGGNVSINVAVDAGGSSVQGNTGQAAELGRRIAGVVRGVLIDERRPGGILA